MAIDTTLFQAAIISCLDFCECLLIDLSASTLVHLQSILHLAKWSFFLRIIQIISFPYLKSSNDFLKCVTLQLHLTSVSSLAFYSPAILEFFQINFLEPGPSNAWCILSNVLLPLPTSSTAQEGLLILEETVQRSKTGRNSQSLPPLPVRDLKAAVFLLSLKSGKARRGGKGWLDHSSPSRTIWSLLT